MIQTMEAKARTLLTELANSIEDAVEAARPTGVPSGVLYAGLMAIGMRLDQYEAFMAGLVKAGRLRKKGHLYFIA